MSKNKKEIRIHQMIKNFGPVKRNMPFFFEELREYIKNNYEEKSSSAIRNILMSSYYKFGYKSIKHGVYVPERINNSYDMVSAFTKEKVYFTGQTLKNKLGLTTQNFSKTTYLIFGEVDKELDSFIDILEDVTIYLLPKTKFEHKIYELLKIRALTGAEAKLTKEESKDLLVWYMQDYPEIYKDLNAKGKVLTKKFLFSEFDTDGKFPIEFDKYIIKSLALVIYGK